MNVVGTFALVAWVFVGLIVFAVDKATRLDAESDEKMARVLCIVGAVVGGATGQYFRLYVFGQLLGFAFAAAGAVLLLSFYRSRTVSVSVHPDGEIADPDPVAQASRRAADAPNPPVGMRLVEAFGWGSMCAVATAVCGFFGHLVGATVYPQRYEQIPSDFFFVPLGLIVGFILAAMARLVRPLWSATWMFVVVALVTLGYTSFMFEYARSRAVGPQFTITFDPDPGIAMRCDPGTCPQTDPAPEWTVMGQMRVQEKNGLGGTIEAISLYSRDATVYIPRNTSREEIAEENKFAGPRVRLTGRQILGSRRLSADEEVAFPLQYAYRTRDGDSRRTIDVYLEFTDGAGHPTVSVRQWKVR